MPITREDKKSRESYKDYEKIKDSANSAQFYGKNKDLISWYNLLLGLPLKKMKPSREEDLVAKLSLPFTD